MRLHVVLLYNSKAEYRFSMASKRARISEAVAATNMTSAKVKGSTHCEIESVFVAVNQHRLCNETMHIIV